MNSQKIDLVIYGAGGFGKEIACLIAHELDNEFHQHYNFIGFIDDAREKGETIKYGNVLGDVSFINQYSSPLAVVFSIANPLVLKSAFDKITKADVVFPNVVSKGVTFYDAPSFTMGKGNVLFNGCRFSCDVKLGNFNLFNGFVGIGHDVQIGDFNVFGPSSRVSGDVTMDSMNFLAINAVILQGCIISSEIKMGAGSIVMRNIQKIGGLYFGNPARKIDS
jgi:sugar O-acyltransferase (sialic acid O-acetyltransferase NeuD family)